MSEFYFCERETNEFLFPQQIQNQIENETAINRVLIQRQDAAV